MARRPLRFRGSKRRVRKLEAQHGRGVEVSLFLLGLLILEALALVPWLISTIPDP